MYVHDRMRGYKTNKPLVMQKELEDYQVTLAINWKKLPLVMKAKWELASQSHDEHQPLIQDSIIYILQSNCWFLFVS